MVVPRERDVEETAQDLRTLAAEAGLEGTVLALPAPGPPPFRGLPRHADASARRAAALLQARAARAPGGLAGGLLRPSLAPHLLETRVVSLRVGDEMTPEILLEALDEGGYAREDPVTAPGQVARRGGILDVFPSDRPEPVRIEFFGDTVESLRRFDPDTQRATGPIEALVTLPLADVFATRSLLAALPAIALRALRGAARARPPSSSRSSAASRPRGSPSSCRSCPARPCRPGRTCPRRGRRGHRARGGPRGGAGLLARAVEDQKRRAEGLLRSPARRSSPSRRSRSASRPPPSSWSARSTPEDGAVHVACRPAPSYAGDVRRLAEDLRARPPRPSRSSGTPGRADRLRDVLREDGSRRRRGVARS